MRLFAIGMAVISLAGWAVADDSPQPATPQKEHDWLKQLEGEWIANSEAIMAPGQPPVKSQGTETIRTLGDLWSVNEIKGEFAGVPLSGIMTVGYDPKIKKYVGTWICSMDSNLVKYVGELDAAGKMLTLDTEGTNPMTGKPVKMKDTIQFKDADTKVMVSSMLGDDGKWVPFMTITSTRKK